MGEVRVQVEGSLRFVQASGSGRSWATGSAPTSGLLAFVQSFQFTSAQTITTISDRGIPDHHKITQKAPIQLTVNALWTGANPLAASGASATVPMYHLEFRASAGEIGAASAFYYDFYGAALQQVQLQEQAAGNTIQLQYMCLGMSGANTSGYLS